MAMAYSHGVNSPTVADFELNDGLSPAGASTSCSPLRGWGLKGAQRAWKTPARASILVPGPLAGAWRPEARPPSRS